MTYTFESLGWALFHSLWQGAACALLLLAILAVTRSPRVRYAAACLALVAVLGAFAFTFARNLPAFGGTARIRLPAAALAPLVALKSEPGAGAALRIGKFLPWIAPLWMAGVILFQVRTIRGWTAARRLRRRGVCSAPEHWQRRLRELAARLRISQPVALLETCIAGVPAAIGYLRPVILVPAGMLTSMPPGQVEAILLHELAHIRRQDYLVNLLQTIGEGLLYFHPAVWWISGVIRAEREHCCDDLAVAALGGGVHEYASALAALEQSRWGVENRQTAAVAATGGSLVKRIHRLLYPGRPLRLPIALAAAPLILAAAGALAGWQTAEPPTGPNADPYMRWLKEDVAYIVSDPERTAFLQLLTKEEREHFIEQFWLRRDPTPGTPENKFKEEHYRRIAYANERFGWKQLAGWKTDRGRIYIVYGPPEEMESHPSGQGGSPSFEKWLYRYLEKVGANVIVEFVSTAGENDYLMTTDPSAKKPVR